MNSVSCAQKGEDSEVKLMVEPERVLIGDPVSIKATGLKAGKCATLTVSGLDQYKNLWSSKATFLIEELSDPVIGVFFKPVEIVKPTPALIVLGGSEGGYNQGWAGVIAFQTRLPTLALAYFVTKNLPQTLENIPLVTIEKAISRLNQKPIVEKDRLGIIGASRGGELAILAASIFPQIKVVVGYIPSGILWEGMSDKHTPAWIFRGMAFPHLQFFIPEEQKRLFLDAQKKGVPYLNRPSFEYSLKMQVSKIDGATIGVEKTKAAFLLIGNPDDGVWPSEKLSKMVINRLKSNNLKSNNYKRPFKLLSYKNGGHMLIPYPYYPMTLRKFYLPTVKEWEGLGGTAYGAAKAAEDSWPKVTEFI